MVCRIADAIEVKKADLEGHIRALTLEDIDQFPGKIFHSLSLLFSSGVGHTAFLLKFGVREKVSFACLLPPPAHVLPPASLRVLG